ncbi:MAG: D-alanyl-D-alanine carboxypeptidase [Ruminococcaceae bacterium]|nr:D-alanyl-D-alanine carboxypeptidase [Oscillospiraceae bacterium]
MTAFLRFFALVLCLFLLGSLMTLAAPQEAITPSYSAPPPSVSAASAVLLDVRGNRFLHEKEADVRRPMASTTKIMTALVVLEQGDLAATVTVPREAVGVEGSSVYLFEGEQITVKNLLYALLLSSANDAAAALAIHVAGSIEAFADLMNQKAAELGLTNTHFTNPHGLYDEAHYTTARELALITAAALKNPTFADIVATKRYEAKQNGTDATRLFVNHNRLLHTLEGACGVKTGFTKKSGRCLVSAAERDGLLLVAVTLSAPDDWRDHKGLLSWGFEGFEGFSPLVVPISLPVVGGTSRTAAIVPAGEVYLTLPRDHAPITAHLELPRFLYGGKAQGARVGQLVYRCEGRVIATLPLVTATDIPKATPHLTLWQRLKNLLAD